MLLDLSTEFGQRANRRLTNDSVGWLTTVRGLLSSARHGGAPRARIA